MVHPLVLNNSAERGMTSRNFAFMFFSKTRALVQFVFDGRVYAHGARGQASVTESVVADEHRSARSGGRPWRANAHYVATLRSRLVEGGLQGPRGRPERFGHELLGEKSNRCAVHRRRRRYVERCMHGREDRYATRKAARTMAHRCRHGTMRRRLLHTGHRAHHRRDVHWSWHAR